MKVVKDVKVWLAGSLFAGRGGRLVAAGGART